MSKKAFEQKRAEQESAGRRAFLFKGFLLSYLTQSEPEAMGLIAKNLDGVQAPGIRGSHEPAIGF